MLTARGQKKGVPLVRTGVPRIELDGAAEFTVGRLPIPVVHKQTPGKRGVRGRHGLVERESLAGGLPRATVRLGDRDRAVIPLTRALGRQPPALKRVT